MEGRKETAKSYRILRNVSVENLRIFKTLYFGGSHNRPHSHENPRLVLVVEGCFQEIYGGKYRECSAYTLIFRPCGEKHFEKFHSGVSVCFSIDVSPAWGAEFTKKVLPENPVHFQSPLLVGIVSRLDQELRIEDSLSDFALQSLVLELLAEISRTERREKLSSPWLKRAVDYLRSGFRQNLCLGRLAQNVGVHPVHLARVFRQAYGCTMADFVRSLRVQYVVEELRGSEKPLSQIALESGFSDQSHFTRSFKRITGTTPARYRTQKDL